jgi:hypothetical protein
MPCFKKPESLTAEIRQRLNSVVTPSATTKPSVIFYDLADRLIKASANNSYTASYDYFNLISLGIQN